MQDKFEKRKQKIKQWFKDPYNLTFFSIFVFSIIIRLYYFWLTKNQPLWWDEADYLAYAKNLAGFNVDWIVTSQHNSLLPYLAAFMFKIGFSLASVKFFLVLVPSFFLVYLSYKIGDVLYDKKIALILAFLMSVFWNILFNSMRFHLGVPALLLAFLAIYVFFKGYEKKERFFFKLNPNYALPIAIIFVVLSYSIRRSHLIFGLFFLTYLILTKPLKILIKDKYSWIGLVFALFLLFFVEKFIFIAHLTDVSKSYLHLEQPINFSHLKYFLLFFQNIFRPYFSVLSFLFLIGLISLIFHVALFFDYFKKQRDIKEKANLFMLLSILITLSYFVFYQRGIGIGEPRWYFPILLPSLVCVAFGFVYTYALLKTYHKKLALFVVVFLLAFSGYYQLRHADYIIKYKIPSFNGIKQASLYLKENSDLNDIILDIPVPQTAFYSERKVKNIVEFLGKKTYKETSLSDLIKELSKKENKNVKYIIVTFSEPNHPEWMKKISYIQNKITGKKGTILEIPFMNTTINTLTGQQHIKQEKTYGNITFKLLVIKDDAFVYEILRNFT